MIYFHAPTTPLAYRSGYLPVDWVPNKFMGMGRGTAETPDTWTAEDAERIALASRDGGEIFLQKPYGWEGRKRFTRKAMTLLDFESGAYANRAECVPSMRAWLETFRVTAPSERGGYYPGTIEELDDLVDYHAPEAYLTHGPDHHTYNVEHDCNAIRERIARLKSTRKPVYAVVKVGFLFIARPATISEHEALRDAVSCAEGIIAWGDWSAEMSGMMSVLKG